ncbi:MAG: hypothetical protein ACYC6L_02645 [Anaerolineae bacterium]
MNQLNLIDDASVEIDLADYSGLLATGYVPETSITDEHIVETLTLYAAGTLAEVKADIGALNRMLSYAGEHPRGSLGVWLQYGADEAADLWRSRIYGGLVQYEERLSKGLKDGRIRIALVLERDPFWEGAETALPLSNGNGTDVTDGLRVFDCNDGAGASPNVHNNWADIDAGDVAGDMPAPLKLEFTNAYDVAAYLSKLWLAGESAPLAGCVIEAEDAKASLSGTVSANSSYSGGERLEVSWTGDTQNWLAMWELPSALLTSARGRWFKVFMRFTTQTTSGIRLQCKLQWSTTIAPAVLITTSREVLTTSGVKVLEIGEFQLPPWPVYSVAPRAIGLNLYAQKTGGGTVYLDYLWVAPVEQFRQLAPITGDIEYQGVLVDDGLTEELRRFDAANSTWLQNYVGSGAPIQLRPGADNRISLMQLSNGYDAEIARVVSLKAWYRPRRRGI